MYAARYLATPGSLFFDGFAGQSPEADHRRLLYCVTASALLLAIGILTVKLPLTFDFSALIAPMLEVSLTKAPQPAARDTPAERPLTETAPPPVPAALRTAEAAPASGAPPADVARPAAAASVADSGARPVDWYEALDRAAAETVERYGGVDSLHPEFDELRRIASERYGKPQTGEPAPAWREEKDIYGRTLLRSGNCFRVLDDPNVGNRYAFETFERHLLQCSFTLGKRPPKNLPWVEPIREKYQHLRDPDGSRSTPADRSSAPNE